jgi:DNA polymerase-3 subunit alpha
VNKEGKEFRFLRFNSVELLADMREKHFKQIILKLRMEVITPALLGQLDGLFNEHPGQVKLQMKLWDEEEKVQVELNSKKVRLNPENSLLEALEKLPLMVELAE